MIRKTTSLICVLTLVFVISNVVQAGGFGMRRVGNRWANSVSQSQPWHGEYYWLRTGQPTALIVPPTATMMQNYSWGVSQNTTSPIYHQFGMGAPTSGSYGQFRATPVWPSHTNQFGVYPVRGPWN
jgi:hypothetical protein